MKFGIFSQIAAVGGVVIAAYINVVHYTVNLCYKLIFGSLQILMYEFAIS